MNTVVRYANPVNALLNDLFKTVSDSDKSVAKSYRPHVDIVEFEHEYKLYADLPGLSKSDVRISVEDGVLTMSGERTATKRDDERYYHLERKQGSFERRFNLPEEVDQSGISAEMKNGELTVTIKKSEKALPKKIDISVN